MKVLNIFTLLLICATVSGQNFLDSRNDLLRMELKGSVKSVKKYWVYKVDYYDIDVLKAYQQQGKEPPKYKKEWRETIDFNQAGYIVKSRCSSSWDNYDLIYRDDNQIISNITYNEDGTIRNTYNFRYDERGFIYYAIKQSDTEVIFEEHFTCDNQGHILNGDHIGSFGSEKYTMEYKDGKLSKFTITKDDKPSMITIFDGGYNRVTEVYQYSGYDCAHRRLKYNSNDLPESVEIETTPGNWYICIRYSYDSHGNEIKRVNYKEDGSVEEVITTSYVYDSHGNWIRKEQKGDYDNIIEREIVYY